MSSSLTKCRSVVALGFRRVHTPWQSQSQRMVSVHRAGAGGASLWPQTQSPARATGAHPVCAAVIKTTMM